MKNFVLVAFTLVTLILTLSASAKQLIYENFEDEKADNFELSAGAEGKIVIENGGNKVYDLLHKSGNDGWLYYDVEAAYKWTDVYMQCRVMVKKDAAQTRGRIGARFQIVSADVVEVGIGADNNIDLTPFLGGAGINDFGGAAPAVIEREKWYLLRFQIEGQRVKVWFYEEGKEPGEPVLDVDNVPCPEEGTVGVCTWQSHTWFDDLFVSDGGFDDFNIAVFSSGKLATSWGRLKSAY